MLSLVWLSEDEFAAFDVDTGVLIHGDLPHVAQGLMDIGATEEEVEEAFHRLAYPEQALGTNVIPIQFGVGKVPARQVH